MAFQANRNAAGIHTDRCDTALQRRSARAWKEARRVVGRGGVAEEEEEEARRLSSLSLVGREGEENGTTGSWSAVVALSVVIVVISSVKVEEEVAGRTGVSSMVVLIPATSSGNRAAQRNTF